MYCNLQLCPVCYSVQRAKSCGVILSDGNGGVPVPAERRPRVRPPVLHTAQQGARTPAQVRSHMSDVTL